jgi:hypothetical protein
MPPLWLDVPANGPRPVSPHVPVDGRCIGSAVLGWRSGLRHVEYRTRVPRPRAVGFDERLVRLGARNPATCGANASSLNAATLSVSATPFSDPATTDPYADFGSRFFVRRSATATVSDHGSLI